MQPINNASSAPKKADILILNATVFDGSGTAGLLSDVAIVDDRILAIGQLQDYVADKIIDATGLALAPGFIDVHTHDDLEVIRNPAMLAKISQGVTTVVIGNCGISATPYVLNNNTLAKLPDPINLLGNENEFIYPQLADYIAALEQRQPAVNVVALVGHTALRAQVMTDLHQPASNEQITAMQAILHNAMTQGATGLSTGLAYHNANAAPTEEIIQLASVLTDFEGKYTTHLRTEFDNIIPALDEAFTIAQTNNIDVIVSHLKCAGKANWGRAEEVLSHIRNARKYQHIGCDSYPYNASSSTPAVAQVTDDFDIFITWSEAHPEMAGQTLESIAEQWQISLLDAAKKLQPAGAVYHGMSEHDVQRFVSVPEHMIGSDGLPCDPSPHPRLWGSFPRVLGHYVREQQALCLGLAIRKMTTLSSSEFNIHSRGKIHPGYYADLVLFDPATIKDKATFTHPKQLADGVLMVWVNGQLSYQHQSIEHYSSLLNSSCLVSDKGAGRFLKYQTSNSSSQVNYDN